MGVGRYEALASLYERHLGRAPDDAGLRGHGTSNLEISEIEKRIINSDEYLNLQAARRSVQKIVSEHGGPQNVLLFGAFGNGNLGDRAMPRIIADWIERNSAARCFAYSDLSGVDYAFPPERVLSREHQPLNSRILECFDGLLIGGGGLLAYHHDPLWNPDWAWQIPIPYIFISCGAATPLDARLAGLVQRALGVGIRDAEGVAECLRYNSRTFHCPDPLLALYKPVAPTRGVGTAYILRGPRREWHSSLREIISSDDKVLLFEAQVDWELLYLFENVHIVRSIDDAFTLLAGVARVVTERFHGAVIALRLGLPTIAVYRDDHNSSKLKSLLKAIGASDWCLGEDEIVKFPILDDREFPHETVQESLANLEMLFQNTATQLLDDVLGKSPV